MGGKYLNTKKTEETVKSDAEELLKEQEEYIMKLISERKED